MRKVVEMCVLIALIVPAVVVMVLMAVVGVILTLFLAVGESVARAWERRDRRHEYIDG